MLNQTWSMDFMHDQLADGRRYRLFNSIEEVEEYATRWLWTYNHERPNMGLDGITPIQKLAMVA